MGNLYSSLKWVIPWGYGTPVEQEDAECVEEVVAKVSDLKEGSMMECSLAGGKILLVKNKEGELSAIGNKCSHYSAPLKTGVYSGDRVRCPWHGACFNTKTGDIEDFPGLDSLPVYKVRVEGENILVKGNPKVIKSSKRVKEMSNCKNASQRFVIIGIGAAGITCAETLRQLKFEGSIVMIGKEETLPYDRPKLSKALSCNVNNIHLRGNDFFEEFDIELKLGLTVVDLDYKQKTIQLSNGEQLTYDSCLVCTGGTPRTLPVKGFDAPNVFALRDHDEAKEIDSLAADKNLLVIGSSFIGMETAAALCTKAKSVTVIGMETVPFERVLGGELGKAIMDLFVHKGIKFEMGRVVKEIITDSTGHAKSVLLDNETTLDCDVIVVGAGVIPTTSFIKDEEIINQRDRSIMCDSQMKAADGLFAAGDIARFPLPLLSNEIVRIEHWGVAMYQGSLAAHGMLGIEKSYSSVPYFWTQLFGKSVRYCGHAPRYDKILIDKDEDGFSVDKMKFAAFYGFEGKVVAVCSMMRDPIVSCCAELMHNGVMPSMETIESNLGKDLSGFLNNLL